MPTIEELIAAHNKAVTENPTTPLNAEGPPNPNAPQQGPQRIPASPAMSGKSLEELQAEGERQKAEKRSKDLWDLGKDAGLGLASGVERGVAGLPGVPADMASLATWLIDKGAQKFTGENPEEYDTRMKEMGNWRPEKYAPYGSEAWIKSAQETKLPGPDGGMPVAGPLTGFKPETGLGKFSQLAGEMLPTAVAPGLAEAGILPRIGQRLPSMVDVSAGRLAGQAAEAGARQAVLPAAAATVGEKLAETAKASPENQELAKILFAMGGATVGSLGARQGTGHGNVGGDFGRGERGAQAAAGRINEMGPEGMYLDASRSTEGRAMGLARTVGEPQQIIEGALRERLESRANRMNEQLDQSFGRRSVNYADETEMHRAEMQNRGNQLYGEARQIGQPVDTTGITATMTTPAGRPRAAMTPTEAAIDEWRPRIEGRTSVEELHRVRSSLSGTIRETVNPDVAGALRGVLRQLDDTLDQSTMRPNGTSAYREARETWAQDQAGLEARERGAALFSGGKTERPDLLVQDLRRMSPHELDQLREGIRDDFNSIMSTTRHDATAAIRYVDTDAAEAKFRALEHAGVLQPGEGEALRQMAVGQAREAQAYNRIVGNSVTAEARAAQEQHNTRTGGLKPLPNTATGYVNAVAEPVRDFFMQRQANRAQLDEAQTLVAGRGLSPGQRERDIRGLQEMYGRKGGFGGNVPFTYRAATAGAIAEDEDTPMQLFGIKPRSR